MSNYSDITLLSNRTNIKDVRVYLHNEISVVIGFLYLNVYLTESTFLTI